MFSTADRLLWCSPCSGKLLLLVVVMVVLTVMLIVPLLLFVLVLVVVIGLVVGFSDARNDGGCDSDCDSDCDGDGDDSGGGGKKQVTSKHSSHSGMSCWRPSCSLRRKPSTLSPVAFPDPTDF
jgi:hypothetical protein